MWSRLDYCRMCPLHILIHQTVSGFPSTIQGDWGSVVPLKHILGNKCLKNAQRDKKKTPKPVEVWPTDLRWMTPLCFLPITSQFRSMCRMRLMPCKYIVYCRCFVEQRAWAWSLVVDELHNPHNALQPLSEHGGGKVIYFFLKDCFVASA